MNDPISISSISGELKTCMDNLLNIGKALAEKRSEVNRLECEKSNTLARIGKLKDSLDKLISEACSK